MQTSICIGVHVHEEPDRLVATLESLRANTAREFELLLLPDGADGPTRRALEQYGEVRHEGTDEPRGPAACLNRLARATKADILVLLESGALAAPAWLDYLVAALEADANHGLAGPSTNAAWNEQCVFPRSEGTPAGIARAAEEAARRYGSSWRYLKPLHSLSDFCYVLRRKVIEAIGLADEGYGLGPCWEMDYNIRAARAGWQGVWACGAYVYRSRFTERRRKSEAEFFERSKRRYQDKFCGARLRGEKLDYREHCRGDLCPNFAPSAAAVQGKEAPPIPASEVEPKSGSLAGEAPRIEAAGDSPLVSCIMPTCDRLGFVALAVRCFLNQDYPRLELIILDDGRRTVAPLLPDDPRIRLARSPEKLNVGAKRNRLCALARGEVIAHWDDDDWYPPDRVRRQVAAFARPETQITGTSVLHYLDPVARQAWRYRYQGGSPWVAGNTLAYRRSWWASHPFPEIQVGEDSRFVWAAPSGAVQDLRWDGLCVARVHEANTSRKQTHGHFWETRSIDALAALVGDDWERLAGTPAVAAPGVSWPLVSCMMPTRDRRAFVPLALEAFEAQDYPNKELVIVDDGGDTVADLAKGRVNIRYLSLPHRVSIGRKRNAACEAARGDIIAHWDDDDWHGPGRLSAQVAPLLAGRADLTGLDNAFQLELAAAEFWGMTPELHQRMFVGNVHGGTLVYRKQLFAEGLRYPDIDLAEDAWFLKQAQGRGKQLIRVENRGLFVYMRHGRNVWRFQTGAFLDRAGWRSRPRPDWFSEDLLRTYRRAAGFEMEGKDHGFGSRSDFDV